jgi:putative transposase
MSAANFFWITSECPCSLAQRANFFWITSECPCSLAQRRISFGLPPSVRVPLLKGEFLLDYLRVSALLVEAGRSGGVGERISDSRRVGGRESGPSEVPATPGTLRGPSFCRKRFILSGMAEKPRIPLEPGKYYHLFNRGVNRNLIFQETADYQKFLTLVERHVCPIGHVYSYALMRDHWHLSISTFPEGDLPPYRLKDKHALGRVIGHLQNAYAKYYNHKYRRVSAVFEHKYERHEVGFLKYFKALVVYHHFNPQKHGFIDAYKNYPWTSYRTLIQQETLTFLQREIVWQKFGGQQAFLDAHSDYNDAFWDKLTVE